MEKRSKRLLVLSLLLAVATGFLIFIQLHQLQQETEVAQSLVPVVVASRNISAPARLTPDMVLIEQIPQEARHKEALADPQEIMGLWVTRDFREGEQVLKPLLVEGEGRDALVFRIPSGMRAVTIPINSVSGVAGHPRAGDRVDVLVTLDRQLVHADRTITLLQDIQILALGSEGDGQASTATLAVTPKQAEELTLADEKGRIRLSLRPATAQDRLPTHGVTPEELVQGRN